MAGGKKSRFLGRSFHVQKEEWPDYADDCPEVGYWTGTILRKTKRNGSDVYACKIVEDGDDAETWEFTFEWIKARLVLLAGEIRNNLVEDGRRRASGELDGGQSIAGGSRAQQSPARQQAVGEAQTGFLLIDPRTTPTKTAALSHSMPTERDETSSSAVRTTPQKRRSANINNWARIRKRYNLGYKFRGEIKPHTELCSKICKSDCAQVSLIHRGALRAQLNAEYMPKGRRGVIVFMSSLVSRKPVNKFAQTCGFFNRSERNANLSANMRCKYCRLGEGTVADRPLVPVLRNHNFTAVVHRKRKGEIIETGCPYFAEGEAFFKAREVEFIQRAPLTSSGAYTLPPDDARAQPFKVCWRVFRNTFGLGKKGKLVRRILKDKPQVVPIPLPLNPGAARMKTKGIETQKAIKEHIKTFPR